MVTDDVSEAEKYLKSSWQPKFSKEKEVEKAKQAEEEKKRKKEEEKGDEATSPFQKLKVSEEIPLFLIFGPSEVSPQF